MPDMTTAFSSGKETFAGSTLVSGTFRHLEGRRYYHPSLQNIGLWYLLKQSAQAALDMTYIAGQQSILRRLMYIRQMDMLK